MKHTPGPWSSLDGTSVCNWHEPTETGQYEMEWISNAGDYPNIKADTNLIAAAPDLLDACEKTFSYLEKRFELCDEIILKAYLRSALDRAKFGEVAA